MCNSTIILQYTIIYNKYFVKKFIEEKLNILWYFLFWKKNNKNWLKF